MAEQSRTRLLQLFKARAVSFGRFKLTSGKESTYYINSKKVLFNSEAVWLLGDVLWDLTMDLDIQAIGGLEIGAVPMAVTAVLHHHMHGHPIEGFFVRKQAKEHGSKQRVEGAIQPGSRVAILDDVFTQGNSVLQAIREVELVGGKVVAAICIVDRLEGARDKLADHYYYLPIFTIRDLGIEPAAETGTS